MKRACLPMLLLATAAVAGDVRFSPTFTLEDFADLGEALGDALAFPNLTTAKPSGIAGFEAMAVAGGLRVAEGERWLAHAFSRGTTLGIFPAPRLLVRKGLPARLDVGVQVGELAGERFAGGELRWSLYSGGVILPAVALSGSYTQLAVEELESRVGELKLVVSKGFAVVAPYAGVGVRRQRTEAFFGDPHPFWRRVEGNRALAFAGLVIHPFPAVRVVAEVKQAFVTSYYLAFGVGL